MTKVENDVIFTGKVERKYVPNYLALSYLSISSIPPLARYQVASPAKLYESLGFGVPVVGNNLPEQGKVLHDSNGGICVEYDKSEFVQAISFLIENPAERDKMSINARKYILNNYTYEIISDRIDQIYCQSMQTR